MIRTKKKGLWMNCSNKHRVEKYLQRHLWVLLIVMTLLFTACSSPNSVTEEGVTPTAPTQVTPTSTSQASFQVVPGDWPTYLADNGRSGYNKNETSITAATAPGLKQHWMYHAKNYISTQPMEAFGMIYWGSWDGLEHATDLNGREVWQLPWAGHTIVVRSSGWQVQQRQP